MATWYIVDGSLPYLEEFPELPEPPIDDAPLSVWRIVNGDLPYKLTFPDMPSIDDAPLSVWLIVDGDLPFKRAFPAMPKPPKQEKPYKAERFQIVLKSYNQTIKLKKYYQKIIITKSTQTQIRS